MRRVTRRLEGERGAIAVMVALFSVVLFAFAALAVDFGAVQAERATLQNAADGAVLAIAQDCSLSISGCPSTGPGLTLGALNGAETTSATLDTVQQTVTVATSSVVNHMFAPVLGINSTTVQASATAAWTPPMKVIRANAYPFIIEACRYDLAKLGSSYPITVTTNTSLCQGGNSKQIPDALAWVAGTCSKTLFSIASPATGVAKAPSCSLTLPQTVLVPLWAATAGTNKSKLDYTIGGFGMFYLTSLSSTSIGGYFLQLDPANPDIVLDIFEMVPGVGGTPGTVTLIK